MKISTKIERVSIPTIIVILIGIKMIMLDTSTRNIFDYMIWGAAIFADIIIVTSRKKNNELRRILFYFGCFLSLQFLGLPQNLSGYAFISIIATVCAAAVFICFAYSPGKMQIGYLQPLFLVTVAYLFLISLQGVYMGNTTPDCMVFMAVIYIICFGLGSSNRQRKLKGFRMIAALSVAVVSISAAFLIGWMSSARTGLLSLAVTILVFVVFTFRRKLVTQHLFWWIVVAVFAGTVLYIHISTFDWYSIVNTYSVSAFGKNLDSSRPYLWSESLKELSWWQWIFGGGTGRLPYLARYAGQSYHNSFIQIIMQNGVLGLAFIVGVFHQFWKVTTPCKDDTIVRFTLAAFIGILVCNSFETCLIQNKAFLGLFHWIIMGSGINRAEYLKRQKGGART